MTIKTYIASYAMPLIVVRMHVDVSGTGTKLNSSNGDDLQMKRKLLVYG